MGRKSAEPEQKLAKYREKRDFDVTREPAGGGASEGERIFVIQKHHARRLHWDLRLEVNGVLASWAIPKEPPRHTGIRRLAVHVEDHPLEYATFEGEIPKGEYGAGKVEIWDKGTYETASDLAKQIEDGKVVVILHGERLDGQYGLVRLKPRDGDGGKDNWLFFREGKHEKPPPMIGAKPGKAPEKMEPMLCTRKETPPKGEDWLHEIKWDGYRVLAHVRQGKATMRTRNGHLLPLPEIEKMLSEADEIEDGVIDGEVCAMDEKGVTRFSIAHSIIRSKDTRSLVFIAFDLPFFDGKDLRGVPIEERKWILERLVEEIGSEKLLYSAHGGGDGRALFDQACEAGLEGIVSKKKGSTYSSTRSPNWVKARCEQLIECWIGGFTRLSSGEECVGALHMGVRGAKGELVYVGKVGTGFTESMRAKLWDQLLALRTEKPPFEPSPELPRKGSYWVEPVTHATVKYLDWSEAAMLRQSKIVKIGEPQPLEKEEAAPKMPAKTKSTELPVRITNPDRVFDPASGLTKGDVAAYYHQVSHLIVPFLDNRPLPVLRCPSGLSEACFFHKHWIKGLPEDVAKVRVEEEDGDEEPYMAITNEKGLLALAQMGVIEFHPWGSRIETLEQPDILIFDLDPGEGMAWPEVAAAAHHVREQLESLGLKTFAKLSGGKGVHVVVPIEPELEWDQAKSFCESFTRIMAKQFPATYTDVMSKAKRKGKIFLDYLRNGRGATAVTAYSLRARENLPAAMPVEWDEVNGELLPNAFDLKGALRHLEKRKKDPWQGFFEARRSLRNVLGG